MFNFENGFPWSNSHELNLDWIIQQVKRCIGIADGINDRVTKNEENIAKNTADISALKNDPSFKGDWDEHTAYRYLSVVYDPTTGNSYTAKKDVPAGIPLDNTEYWALTGNFNQQLADAIAKSDKNAQDIAKNASDIIINQELINANTDAIAIMKSNSANVRDYGAVGDGLTDDTEAFKKALASGKAVYVPSGKYVITDLDIAGIDSIFGDGRTSIIMGTFKPSRGLELAKFSNLKFKPATKVNAFDGSFAFCIFENIEFENCDICYNFGANSWINLFNNNIARHSNIFVQAVDQFNSNQFVNTIIQHVTTGFKFTRQNRQNMVIGGDIEFVDVAFNVFNPIAMNVDSLYIESVTNTMFNLRGAIGSYIDIKNCYLYAGEKSGWLAKSDWHSTFNFNPAVCTFDNNVITGKFNTIKPILLTDDGVPGKFADYNFNITNNRFDDGVAPTYADFFGISNYNYSSNHRIIKTDLPIVTVDSDINFYSANVGVQVLRDNLTNIVGEHAYSGTGGNTIQIPVSGMASCYPQTDFLSPVHIVFSDNTVEPCRGYIDTSNITILSKTSKPISKIIFNTSFYR